jgi:hypothetical protein
MNREDYVAHRLGGLLYEAWTPSQVQAVACLACEAVDEWIRDRLLPRSEARPSRLDHTVVEAHAYRDGIEDVTSDVEEWLKFWEAE